MIQETLQIIAEFKDAASAALQNLQKTLLGIGGAATGATSQINGLNSALDQTVKSNAGVNRELLVLAHELSQGQFNRFAGSLLVLGEQVDALGKAFQILALGGGVVGAAIGAVATAVAFVGYELYKTNAYAKELNQTFALTNNFASLTQIELERVAQTLSSSLVTSAGKAKDAMLELGKTGKFTADQLPMISEVVVKQSKLSGESVEDLIKKYTKLAEQPSKLAAEVNASMHILTPAQQEQIRNLENTGLKAQASQVLYQAMINYFNGPAKQAIEEQIGLLDKWSQGWAYGLDLMAKKLGLVKKPLIDQIKDINTQLKAEFGQTEFEDVAPAKYQPKLQALLDKRKELYRQAAAEEQKATTASFNAFQSQQAQEASNYLTGKLSNGGKTLQQALKEFDDEVKKLRSVNPASNLLDPAQLAKARQGIIDSYRDPAVEQAARQSYAAEITALDSYIQDSKDHWNLFRAQLKTQLTRGEIDQDEFNLKMHSARVEELKDAIFYGEAKVKTAANEAQRTVNREGVRDKQKFIDDIRHINNEIKIENENYEGEQVRHGVAIKLILDRAAAELEKQNAARRTAMEREFNKLNLSANEAAYEDAKNAVRDRFAAIEERIRAEFKAKHATDAELNSALSNLAEQRDKALADERGYFDKRLAMQADWRVGAIKSFREYQEAASNIAAQAAKLMSDVTKTVEDAIFKFLETGKFSFKEFLGSFKTMIDRMIAQALAAKLMSALFGGTGTGGQGGAAFGSFFAGLFGARAEGGPVSAGQAYLVGERGPEPFIPNQNGTILPSSANLQQPMQMNISVNAIDSKDFITKMAEVKREMALMMNDTNRKYNLRAA